MKRSTDRILTTHVGSLPRPVAVLDLMKEKLSGATYDKGAYANEIRNAIGAAVRKQVETGIDIVADGEISKPGFFVYVRNRLIGFEARPNEKFRMFADELAHFPEYYKQYFERAMFGATVTPAVPLYCVGPVSYIGQADLKQDIDNLKAAVGAAKAAEAFIPSTAPSGVGYNAYTRPRKNISNGRRGAAHGISRHRRGGIAAASRRSVPIRHFRRFHARRCRAPQACGHIRGIDQLLAARHP
jgi:5-methyltetrahydropteroyltriglutamate--homocysteine methyltransferase